MKKKSFFKRLFGLSGHEEESFVNEEKLLENKKMGLPVEEEEKKAPPAEESAKPVESEIVDKEEGVVDEGGSKLEVITRKLTEQEEMSLKISQGLKGLTSHLGEISDKLEEQTKKSTELVTTVQTIPDKLKDLPESSRAGLELLKTISRTMESQSKSVENLNGKISGLSNVMNDVAGKMENDSRERVEEVQVFQESIGTVKDSITELSDQHSTSTEEHSQNIRSIATVLKKVSEENQSQVEGLLGRQKTMNRLVIFLIFVIIAGLVAVVLKLG